MSQPVRILPHFTSDRCAIHYQLPKSSQLCIPTPKPSYHAALSLFHQLYQVYLPVHIRLSFSTQATRLSQDKFLGLGLPHLFIPHLLQTAPPSISIRSLHCNRPNGDSSYCHSQPRRRELSLPLPRIQRRRTRPLARNPRRPRLLHPARNAPDSRPRLERTSLHGGHRWVSSLL